MPLQWIKNKWFIIFIAISIILFFLLSIYFVQYRPVTTQVKTLENELRTDEKMLAVLEGKTANKQKNTAESSFSLQKRIPVKPLTDQLILDIEKAETVSNVFIKDMSISEVVQDNQVGLGQSEPSMEIKDGDEAKEWNQLSDVEKVTLSLSLEAQNYFDFEAFLNFLEGQNRIVQVEQISVTAPMEMTKIVDLQEPLRFNVTISAFYIPSLKDIIDQAPKIDSPPPANKKDPFNNFPVTKREKK
ncbi:hypothetical protein ACFFF5_00290 [Lederbergia wuyishanensis]|uniref:Type IV pilus assembly protein PilO n=1 Tax=Lederbergia wuyishanensis TaxID=1347903 RepID=A0ABU0D1U5_9BACI|nr:hypothetical protein [Lederbergia wuyishanensis]MCJ8006986.1 hypothetical protein [Lederbergia wuyishanensis]MDQ0342370.1 type IV pilus assembly protein PilO [Lederbergia wuyishanensis]